MKEYEINKFDKQLHLVGSSMWIILWCTDPRTSIGDLGWRKVEWWSVQSIYINYWKRIFEYTSEPSGASIRYANSSSHICLHCRICFNQTPKHLLHVDAICSGNVFPRPIKSARVFIIRTASLRLWRLLAVVRIHFSWQPAVSHICVTCSELLSITLRTAE